MSDGLWRPRTPEEYKAATEELRELSERLKRENEALRRQLGHSRESHAASAYTLNAQRDR